MARDPDQPLYEKPWQRTVQDTKEERDMGYGRLLDFGKGYNVELRWRTNNEVGENQIFTMEISGRDLDKKITLYLNAEQMNKYIRWV